MKFQSPRGMHDVLPQQATISRVVERTISDTFANYGYGEIRLPLAEQSALFHRSIGAGTDIIDKEMYHLRIDAERQSSTPLSLRPEGTAGCLRAVIQHGLLREGARLWYQGEMFRHERPQQGRFRQFRQMGAEVVGFGGVETDAELLSMGSAIWRKLGVESRVRLEINSLGSAQTRARYHEDLVAFLRPHVNQLDADSQKRLNTNPLRILDSKHKTTQSLLQEAPKLVDYWEAEDAKRFADLQKILQTMKIAYHVNHTLVRGLDYYGGLVFEWLLLAHDGAQDTLAAGGRYDGLVTQLGGQPAPAAGFAIGMERLEALVLDDDGTTSYTFDIDEAVDAYIVVANAENMPQALSVVEELRRTTPEARICGPVIASEKAQLRRAKKSSAKLIFSCETDATGAATWRVSDTKTWQNCTAQELTSLLRKQVKIRTHTTSHNANKKTST